jgi:ferrochelatase
VNLGSPDSPAPRDVYRYLTEFLNDPRVIDIPWIGRKLLVNGIIVPFRHRKSAKIYKQLWTENGSPLIHFGKRVRDLLQNKFDHPAVMTEHGELRTFLAMRYQNPSIEKVLEEIRLWNANEIIVLPLFPQYASASTGSVVDKVLGTIRKWWVIPDVRVISQFYDHPGYIRSMVKRAEPFKVKEYDHVLFSYHGLPERHLDKVYINNLCEGHDCESEITEENEYCYKATCYATTRLIAKDLGLSNSQYTVCFQSRLGKGWITPFSDVVIESLAKKGAKKILVFSPAFVADCLETTIEIGVEYNDLFRAHGGEHLQLVPGLNDNPDWIDALSEILLPDFHNEEMRK